MSPPLRRPCPRGHAARAPLTAPAPPQAAARLAPEPYSRLVRYDAPETPLGLDGLQALASEKQRALEVGPHGGPAAHLPLESSQHAFTARRVDCREERHAAHDAGGRGG